MYCLGKWELVHLWCHLTQKWRNLLPLWECSATALSNLGVRRGLDFDLIRLVCFSSVLMSLIYIFLKVLIWDFWGCWNILTWAVWYLDLNLGTATGLWYTHVLNFSFIFFWRWKEPSCPFSTDLGLYKTLEVTGWDLASLSLFGYSHWSVIHLCSE